MGKKKNRQSGDSAPDTQALNEPSSAPAKLSPTAPTNTTSSSAHAPTTKKEVKPVKAKAKAIAPFSPSPLIICRNKHWRYIACFHGPWLQMPIEILETMASINYNTPRPHPVDPAVFYDMIKIRKLVEEATDLAVRAASDLPSQASGGGLYGGSASNLGLGLGPGQHGTRLSRERKYRMNLQACQKLARAYRLDEIACSVATMQGASTLDDIGSHVLQRNRDEMDGKYVHFFHEKIPSRQLADHTSLQPLNEIIERCPADPEPYRTRAMIRGFMHNFEGAVADFSQALDVHRLYGKPHQSPPAPEAPSGQNGLSASGKRPPDVRLREEEQPSSLVPQLQFMRACAYLTLACNHVRDTVALAPADFPDSPLPSFLGDASANSSQPVPPENGGNPAAELGDAEVVASRRTVKNYARRALKDFLAFLSHLEYTPHMPQEAVTDFTEKIGQAASGNRNPRYHHHHHAQNGGASLVPEVIYPVSELFSAAPPSDLPPYPPPGTQAGDVLAKAPTGEACTYHPLLTEALHSLLLCHCLLQTSRTELTRHAHNVARLARLADAYPVFQASRSAARADWVDVLEKTELAASLVRPWDVLCAPAPLPSPSSPTPSSPSSEVALVPQSNNNNNNNNSNSSSSSSSSALAGGSNGALEKAGKGGAAAGGGDRNPRDHPPYTKHHQQRALTRWSVTDDGKEYPIVTDRALLVARWMRDVPFLPMGTARKKRRTGTWKRGKLLGPAAGVENGLKRLDLNGAEEE